VLLLIVEFRCICSPLFMLYVTDIPVWPDPDLRRDDENIGAVVE